MRRKLLVLSTSLFCGCFSGVCENTRIEVVAKDIQGNPVTANSFYSMTDDTRFVLFSSHSNDITSGDTNFVNGINLDPGMPGSDVFFLDRQQVTTLRISLDINGEQFNSSHCYSNSMSSDSHRVCFTSIDYNTDGYSISGNIFLFDTSNNTREILSVSPDGAPANGACSGGQISGDGNYVLYYSGASNLLPNNSPIDSNGELLLLDLNDRSVHSLTNTIDGTKINGTVREHTINHDGSIIVFESNATNLTEERTGGIFLYQRDTDRLELITKNPNGEPVVFDSQQFERPESLDISADGRFVFYISRSNGIVDNDPHPLYDGFIYDRQTGTTQIVPLGNYDESERPFGALNGSISSNGRYIVTITRPRTEVTGYELFRYDRQTGEVRRLLTTEEATPIFADLLNQEILRIPYFIHTPRITPDGQSVLFTSDIFDMSVLEYKTYLFLLTVEDDVSFVPEWELNR